MPLIKNENNLGEFLYTVPAPKTFNTGPALTINQNQSKKLNADTVSNSPVVVGSNKKTIGATIITITYPLPPVVPVYDNLPPEPTDITNNLTDNKDYVFSVTASLKEYVNNTWIDAKNKNNTSVTQSVTQGFRTGPMFVVTSSVGPNINLNKNIK